ncbi:MAG: hypothetical protein K2I21_15710 [Acetatifactor sp.]|nr:hypothetical protein [Acetatifactor sp.]
MNEEVIGFLGIKLEKREEYAIEYIEEILAAYAAATNLNFSRFVSGIGHRKSIHQKQYQKMQGYAIPACFQLIVAGLLSQILFSSFYPTFFLS